MEDNEQPTKGIITQPDSPQSEGVDPLTTGQTMYSAPEPPRDITRNRLINNEWANQDPAPQHYYSPGKFKKTTNGDKVAQAKVAKQRVEK